MATVHSLCFEAKAYAITALVALGKKTYMTSGRSTGPAGSSSRMSQFARAAMTLAVVLGCAGQPRLGPEERNLYGQALDRWLARTIQLQSINQRIRKAGAEICGRALSPVLGLVLVRISELPPALRPIARERFGDADRVRVVSVLDGFPAEKAGVQVGDTIREVGGVRVVSTRNLYGAPAVRRGSFPLVLTRGDRVQTIDLEHVSGCDYPAELADTEAFNAYATGNKVIFFNGLMRTMKTDASIAFVMGHEIGHNIQFDTTGQRSDGLQGEARADYLGIYLAERAGYRLTPADFGLARRAYAAPRRLESRARTHPSGAARLFAFEQTLDEIAGKRAAGAPLIPEGLR